MNNKSESYNNTRSGFLTTNLVNAWLVAGSLDALAAIVLLANGKAEGVFRYIASAAFGKEAFSGGFGFAWFGVITHYFIAFCFTGFYFFIYQYLPFLRKNWIVSAVIYGLFVQFVMAFLVLPLTQLPDNGFNAMSFIKNAVILMFSIGVPVCWFRQRDEQLK